MKIVRAALVPALALCLSSCVGFHKQWLAAQKAFPPPQQDLRGAWVGSWTSGHNAHTGKLRCVVSETAPGKYNFYYWATWGRVLSGGFKIECAVENKDGAYVFAGDKDLGKLGGAFTHSGKGSPGEIKATWRSERGDHGTFELARPGGGG